MARALLLALLCVVTLGCADDGRSLRLVSTTTTENSGLLAHVLPRFEQDTGIRVYVATMGTGQALRSAREGNADLLIVHDADAEAAFMAEGWGSRRDVLMSNRFLLVGPASDPAGIAGGSDVANALRRLAVSEAAIFVSRADDSGTHKRERQAWQWADIDPYRLGGYRYREAGAGMGKTLNIAASIDAYTLVDLGTWLNFGNRQRLRVLVDGDPRLHNPYALIELNGERYPGRRLALARRLADWLRGPAGQQAIGDYRIDGRQLFAPAPELRHAGRHDNADEASL